MKTMVAPEPYLSACLQVLRYSILYCRFRAWSSECSADHIADLMDAVHNIPDLIVKWEHCDIDPLRKYLLLTMKSGSAEAVLGFAPFLTNAVLEAERRL